jgi:DNA-binding beta-propeller fold protein YncE
MSRFFAGITACLAVVGLPGTPCSRGVAEEPPAPRTPGPQPDGSVILPTQWSLRPAGRQLTVGDFPVSIAIHPDGGHAAVLHCGFGPHELVVLDIAARSIVSRTHVPEAFYGVAFDSSGEKLFCSGSEDEVVRRYRFKAGVLVPDGEIRLRPQVERGIPAGLAVSGDGHRLYVANLWGHSISLIDMVADGGPAITHLSLARDGRAATAPVKPAAVRPSAAERPADKEERPLTKRAEQLLENTDPSLPFPYACVLDEPRGRLYVSLWAQAAVAVIELATRREIARWPVEEHPNEMLLAADGTRLFVANANRNSVSVIDPDTGGTVETLVATLTPNAPPGNTPNSLVLSADGRRLFVANAGINAVAVFDVAEGGKSRSLGFIPVGWYPTSVRLSADGLRLVVANGKGIISEANRNGPRPGYDPSAPTPAFIGSLFQGTIGFIDLPTDETAFARQMAEWTSTSFACMPPRLDEKALADLAGHPVPRSKADGSPITHVIYIVKENRTYDQVLGDMPRGRGDPSLCLFPEKVTPNHHAIARDFVLLDNFFVESEVSADGHEWSMGAYATDFVEKQWPLIYGHSKKFPYASEGGFVAARPAGGYIWDRAIAAGVTVRSYGEWVANGPAPGQPGRAKTPALEGRFDPLYRGFDMNYSDLDRAARFIEELSRFEREGEMPRLQIVRLPNDHTSGTQPGSRTPTSCVAENDLALGRIRRGGLQVGVLAEDGDFRRRGRRPKWIRPRRCPPHGGSGRQSVLAPQRGRFHSLFDQFDAADDRADSRPRSDVPVRRGGDADVRLLPAGSRPVALSVSSGRGPPRQPQCRHGLGRRRILGDGLLEGGRRGRSPAQRGRMAERAWFRFTDACPAAGGLRVCRSGRGSRRGGRSWTSHRGKSLGPARGNRL